MNLFCSHLTATLNLLPLGIIKASFVSALAYSQISVFRFHFSVIFHSFAIISAGFMRRTWWRW